MGGMGKVYFEVLAERRKKKKKDEHVRIDVMERTQLKRR